MEKTYNIHIEFADGSNPWVSLPIYSEKDLKVLLGRWKRNYEVISERSEEWGDGSYSTTFLKLAEKVRA